MPPNNSTRVGGIERGAGAPDLSEYVGAFRLPPVQLGIGIALGQIELDVTDQFGDRAEAAGADNVAGQISEESARPD